MKRTTEEPIIDDNLWLLTMSDLLLILLALFVLRLSMGSLPDRTALRGQLPSSAVTGGNPSMRIAAEKSPIRRDTPPYLEHESGGGGKFALPGVIAIQRGLTTHIKLRGVFSAASDEVSFHGAANLGKIARAIADEQVEIGVSVAIAPDTYPAITERELASLTITRTAAVLRQMIDAGVGAQALYGNFADRTKPSVTYSEDGASEMVELLIRRPCATGPRKR